MARYVDGFAVAVPKKNIQAYRRISAKAGKTWRKYGALEYREYVHARRMVYGGFKVLVDL